MVGAKKKAKLDAQRERRKNEKLARKAANISKVEQSKEAKAIGERLKDKEVKKVKEDTSVKTAKDNFELLRHEQAGATIVNVTKREYIYPAKGTKTVAGRLKRPTNPHRISKHRSGHARPVCVVTADKRHVRVTRQEAEKLVAAGGRYIPKNEYQGTIKDPETGQRVNVDWSHKE